MEAIYNGKYKISIKKLMEFDSPKKYTELIEGCRNNKTFKDILNILDKNMNIIIESFNGKVKCMITVINENIITVNGNKDEFTCGTYNGKSNAYDDIIKNIVCICNVNIKKIK